MGKPVEESFGEKSLKWILRFIKFNVIGFVVFLLGTGIFLLTFHTLGVWAWFIASATGGVLQFILISYLNRTKIGRIFDSSEEISQGDEDKKIKTSSCEETTLQAN